MDEITEKMLELDSLVTDYALAFRDENLVLMNEKMRLIRAFVYKIATPRSTKEKS